MWSKAACAVELWSRLVEAGQPCPTRYSISSSQLRASPEKPAVIALLQAQGSTRRTILVKHRRRERNCNSTFSAQLRVPRRKRAHESLFPGWPKVSSVGGGTTFLQISAGYRPPTNEHRQPMLASLPLNTCMARRRRRGHRDSRSNCACCDSSDGCDDGAPVSRLRSPRAAELRWSM